MKQIQLTQGKFALVDDEDYDWLMQWKWQFFKDNQGGGYASRREKRKTLLMHRELNRTPDGLFTDHKDQNKLNNQRYNFRTATKQQNGANKRICPRKNGGRYKGVFWYKKRNQWAARITFENKQRHLGWFKKEEEEKAALAYNESALKIFGEFACINQVG